MRNSIVQSIEIMPLRLNKTDRTAVLNELIGSTHSDQSVGNILNLCKLLPLRTCIYCN